MARLRSGWRRNRRAFVRGFVALVGGAGAMAVQGLDEFGLADFTQLPRLVGIVVIGCWTGWLVRLLAHAVMYRDAPGRAGVKVKRLIGLDAGLTAIWGLLAFSMVSEPRIWVKWPTGVVLLALGVGLYSAVNVTAACTLRMATKAHKPRASDAIRDSAWGSKVGDLLAALTPIPGAAGLRKLWTRRSPAEHVSAYVAFIAATLVAAGAATAPAAMRAAAWPESIPKENSEDPRERVDATPEPEPATQPGGGIEPATPSPPIETPTYEETCGHRTPGEPAPEPAASQLRSLWLGGPGQPGAGALQAGCARAAARVAAHPEVWFARGYCGASLRSIGIFAPGRPPALLLQQAARFASDKAESGLLLGATPRTSIGAGDFYFVDTPSGSFLLIRSNAAIGTSDDGAVGTTCDALRGSNVPYAEIPPPLVALWLDVIRHEWVWPEPDFSRELAGDFVFLSGGQDREVVATASCASSSRCTLYYQGRVTASSESPRVSVDDVLPYAPSAQNSGN